MNWVKLLTNQCPKCGKILFPNHATLELVRCGGFCNFSIRYGKLIEMQAGMHKGYSNNIKSPAYKKKVATNKKIDKYNKLQKERQKKATITQEEERLSNLRRREAGSKL